MAEKKLTTSAQYSITIRLENPHESGWIAKISSTIGRQGGVIAAVDLVNVQNGMSVRDYSVECSSQEHEERIIRAVKRLKGIKVHSVSDETFRIHLGGKIEVNSKIPVKTRADLSMAYTPGVARVCMAIHRDYESSFNLTIRKNCIAVVSDGSAVLGLGNIGAAAAMPVMEGKCVLFKEFGGVDAIPLCLDTQDTDAIVDICKAIAPTIGGINLEDIAAPRCFEIEERLIEALDVPVFHDDQHGTAVVVLAGVINALKLTGHKPGDLKLVIAGAGAAGLACARALKDFGVKNQIVCDSKGAIHAGREGLESPAKRWLARSTNPHGEQGTLKQVIRGADMFLGLATPGILSRADVRKMNKKPIVFAMGNPDPEITPEEVGNLASVMATGRSDYPNQINNVLAFPGIFRGALDARASRINRSMKQAAAKAIARAVSDDELSADYIIPSVFNARVASDVAAAVARAARRSKVARRVPKAVGPSAT